MLPGGDLSLEPLVVVDAPVQALALEHPDLNLGHVEPAGMLGGEVELQPTHEPMGFRRRGGLLERAGRVRRQVVRHHPDRLRLREIDIGELAHAGGKILCRAPLPHLHPAPGPVHIEDYEKIGGAVAAILVINALDLPGRGWDRLTHLTDELGRALVEAHHRRWGSGASA